MYTLFPNLKNTSCRFRNLKSLLSETSCSIRRGIIDFLPLNLRLHPQTLIRFSNTSANVHDTTSFVFFISCLFLAFIGMLIKYKNLKDLNLEKRVFFYLSMFLSLLLSFIIYLYLRSLTF